MATLTIETSAALSQETCAAIAKYISSLESVGGHTLSLSLDGQKIAKSGRGRARASRSAPQEKRGGARTKGISGPSGIGSLNKTDLQLCLESRLLELFNTDGSTRSRTTLSRRATPSGLVYSRFLSSAPRTIGETGSISWRTPVARDFKGYTKRDGESICNQLRSMYGGVGRPNPDWLAWLMGYPVEWSQIGSGVLAMPSYHRQPRSSSKRSRSAARETRAA